ncbi:hypothetical protein FEM48_Zijuj09G0215700 [Ziziphus jujuba var. spinosa]|uniref:Uncharacterized protein n=1 Tax=Ziziphus jujuba var. spinosa TaxID=714518 RepID=A0A978UVF7_ZIZJJ|nr:hypothetical protein FEM48_Zijuj09G0215700 [Ziziphus jujuba var. spinosa]
MPMLTYLDISWNSHQWRHSIVSISNLTELTSFNISNNHLSGEVPDILVITNFLGNFGLDRRKHGWVDEFTINVQLLQWKHSSRILRPYQPSHLRSITQYLSGHIPHCLGNFDEMRSDDIYFVGSSTLALTNGSFKIMAKANKSHRTANFEFISKSFDREDSSNIGKIPTANQFLTFDDPSIYQGNVGLCGKPLDNDCLGSSQFGTPRGEKEDKDGYEHIAQLGMVFDFRLLFCNFQMCNLCENFTQ